MEESILSWIDNFNALCFPQRFEQRWADDEAAQAEMTAKVPDNMAACAKMIQDHYFAGPFVLGKSYSICDPYLALITRWLGPDGVSLDDFPKLKDHDAMMKQRPSVKRVLQLYD